MSERTNRGASNLRKRYWQEHGRPPEGEGPHPDMGGPAYIPWLEALVTQLEAEVELFEESKSPDFIPELPPSDEGELLEMYEKKKR